MMPEPIISYLYPCLSTDLEWCPPRPLAAVEVQEERKLALQTAVLRLDRLVNMGAEPLALVIPGMKIGIKTLKRPQFMKKICMKRVVVSYRYIRKLGFSATGLAPSSRTTQDSGPLMWSNSTCGMGDASSFAGMIQ
jgi:hypothetical protein